MAQVACTRGAVLVRCSQTAGCRVVCRSLGGGYAGSITFVLRLRINRAMGRAYVRSRPWRSGATTDHVRRGTST
jgi:hypothetical protein